MPAITDGTGRPTPTEEERRRLAAEEEKKDAESTDPCGDYADDLIDALNKVNDGTNSSFDPPAQPAGCAGPSGRGLAGYVRVMGTNWLREIGEIFTDWKEATAGVAELEAEERDKAIEEYRKAWNELPWPVQVTTTYAGCAVLSTAALGAIVKGKPSVAARISQRAADLGCTIGVDWIDLSIDDSDPGDEGGTGDENSAGNYCGAWTASAFGGRPGRGGVTLFVNGAAYSQVQSSYGNRDWAIARLPRGLSDAPLSSGECEWLLSGGFVAPHSSDDAVGELAFVGSSGFASCFAFAGFSGEVGDRFGLGALGVDRRDVQH